MVPSIRMSLLFSTEKFLTLSIAEINAVSEVPLHAFFVIAPGSSSSPIPSRENVPEKLLQPANPASLPSSKNEMKGDPRLNLLMSRSPLKLDNIHVFPMSRLGFARLEDPLQPMKSRIKILSEKMRTCFMKP